MKTIIEQAKFVNKFLGKQQYDETIQYRMLTYCVVMEHNGKILLMNTLTRQLLELAQTEYNSLIKDKNSVVLRELVGNWFFVPVDYDDLKLKEQVYTYASMFAKKPGITRYIIFPTMECNARCFYCFEHGSKRYPMTEQTALNVVDFIEKKSLGQKVKIQWFGGEPLYNYSIIDLICSQLSNKGIEFDSIMVSNGYLFDEDIINKARYYWNLEMVQITLDGTEEVYNRCKSFIHKNSDSPFCRVINNIEQLIAAKIKVIVRINMDKHNKEDLYQLVDLLYERFKNSGQYFGIYAWLLYDNRGAVKSIRSDAERHELTKSLIDLEDYIYEKGLSLDTTPNPDIRLGACIADDNNSTTILPDGRLGKCDHHSDDEFWGSIYSDEVDTAAIDSWKERRPPIKLCNTCPLYPQCIKLKKCPDDGAYDCDEYEQEIRLNRLKHQMANAADKFYKNESSSDS